MTDYIRDPMGRLVAKSLSWTVALGLLIIGTYSVITAGW
jgi:succinate dehydrogenase / fumarate reductase membrane anchor subunit